MTMKTVFPGNYMTPVTWRNILIRFSIVWLCVSVACLFFAESIIQALLPFIKFVINCVAHNYDVELGIVNGKAGSAALNASSLNAATINASEMNAPITKNISILVTLTENLYRVLPDKYSHSGISAAPIPIAPKGTRIEGSGTLLHAMVPIVILFTILISWPAKIKKMLIQIVLGIPFAFVIIALTTPLLLLAHVENVFQTAAENYIKTELPTPFLMWWVMLMEGGGVWLLPIVAALLCIGASSVLMRFVFSAPSQSGSLS